MLLGAQYEDLISHGIDVSIRIGELLDSNLIARRILQSKMIVCASPGYLKQHSTPKKPEDLTDYNCLLHQDSPTGNTWLFQGKDGDLSIDITGSFSASTSQTLEAAALAGVGIVMLPGYMMLEEIKQGLLVPLLDEYCKTTINIHALYSSTRHLAPKIRLFIDFLLEWFSKE